MRVLAAIVSRLVIALLVAAIGACSDHENHGEPEALNPKNGDVGVEASRIDKLRLGMSMQEVTDALGASPMAASVPALLYPAKGEGLYYAAFCDVNSPQGYSHDIGLQFIVHFPKSDVARPQFVFPPEKRGQEYVSEGDPIPPFPADDDPSMPK